MCVFWILQYFCGVCVGGGCQCIYTDDVVHVRKSEDNCMQSVLSLQCHMGCRQQIHFSRLGSKHFYPLGHVANQVFSMLFKTWTVSSKYQAA